MERMSHCVHSAWGTRGTRTCFPLGHSCPLDTDRGWGPRASGTRKPHRVVGCAHWGPGRGSAGLGGSRTGLGAGCPGRGACAGDLGRAGTPPVHLNEAPLFEGRVFIPVTCCLPGRAVHGAVGPVLSLLPTRCTWHLLCLQPLPTGPALPGASTPHLPWCGAEDEAPGRGQLGCRATLPHAHPHPRLCPASASDHAPGSGAAPGKAARGSLSPRQEPG